MVAEPERAVKGREGEIDASGWALLEFDFSLCRQAE